MQQGEEGSVVWCDPYIPSNAIVTTVLPQNSQSILSVNSMNEANLHKSIL